MKVLQLRTPGSLKGPVTPPPATANKLDAVKAITLSELFEKLKELVREAESQTKVETKLEAPLTQLPGSASPTGSSQHSHYASATSMADSHTSEGVERKQFGPSGAAMLQTRSQWVSNERPRAGDSAAVSRPNANPDRLQSFFNSAIEPFLKEQRAAWGTPTVPLMRETEPQDVNRESVGSDHGEYDPDDLDLPAYRQATVATAATATGLPAITPRIRVSAMSELKEFSGKDDDADRPRAWVGKVKSAFVRDQAPDAEKCLVLGSLFTGPARNWYRQLGPTTRGDWKELLREFQVQFCGLGVSLRVKSGPSDVRREYVKHFIETLDDRDLADQLALLRILDADALEEVLRARQHAKNRQGRAHFGSSKYRQKSASSDATNQLQRARCKPSRPPTSWTVTATATLVLVDRSQMVIYAGSTWPQRKESRKLKRLRQTNPTGPRLAKPHQRETLAQARDPHMDALSSTREEIGMLLQVSGNRMSSRELTQSWRSNYCLVRYVGTGNITHPINNEKADLLLDSSSEVSILDAAFARKVGCYVDESRQQECVGIGEGVYVTKGRTKIKAALAGSLVYFFDVWVGEMTGQDAIIGMDFMVPAGIRLDLADGTLCLPDEIRIQLSGRRPLCGSHVGNTGFLR
ncbi:hypothetical protein F443_05874 [Phytophthora nicotianae P1569]|uniref:Retrotransposon gag domain-containing protein n=1 Tax=Phytophthora nicotianae P1569 TaxID=1317065 RepID=V9FHP2_PHYNI|nr:hypothetical protein F443_05874 [Phytophthora nicotianae P1569]